MVGKLQRALEALLAEVGNVERKQVPKARGARPR
jgi:hypothetical protein